MKPAVTGASFTAITAHGLIQISRGPLQNSYVQGRARLLPKRGGSRGPTWRFSRGGAASATSAQALARTLPVHGLSRRFSGFRGGNAVRDYRLYWVDGEHLLPLPYEFEAPDDASAIALAQEHCRDERRMELWHQARKVRCWGFPGCPQPGCNP